MRSIIISLAALLLARRSTTSPLRPGSGCAADVVLDATTNIWKNYTLYPTNDYRAKVQSSVERIQDAEMKQKAMKVADVGTFLWLQSSEDVAKIEKEVANAPCNQIVGLVLQNLPNRKCTSSTSKPVEGDTYQADFIDALVSIMKAHPNTAFALIIEPETLPLIVLNAELAACKITKDSYYKNVPYALSKLNLPNVIMYLDVGHGGQLGWKENQKPGASVVAAVWEAAGKPKQLRGFATNVANYNSWDLSPGEFATRPDYPYPDPSHNPAQNEQRFVQLFSKAVEALGAPYHAITDSSRSAVQGLRYDWLNWCNVNGAGFGIRQSTNTKEERADALLWVKQGGVSDGTSEVSSTEYETVCGMKEAVKPMPQRGEWSDKYFEMLVRNAKPSF